MKTAIFLFMLYSLIGAKETTYKPSESDKKAKSELITFPYGDRKVPLKIYFPASQKPAPVILLSHGLGGSREIATYLGNRWANAGYIVVAMQHIGSDESVWKGKPKLAAFLAMKKAGNFKTFIDRAKDVIATISQLEQWNIQKSHSLEKRINLKRIGLAGHSYGALTTQALVGQSFGKLGARYLDKRIIAAFAMSPNVPRRGEAGPAFHKISVPMLLMTGTDDQNFITKAAPETRRGVFKALTPLNKNSLTRHYELVFKGAEHGAFVETPLPGEGKQNPNHHNAIKTISTAFWDSTLKSNPNASKWLNGKKPVAHLQKEDLWLKK